MIELVNIQPDDMVADLGAGDGRLSIAFGQAGAVTHGYELDPDWVKCAQDNIKNAKVDTLVSIHQKDFWNVDLKPYQIICIYPMPDIMDALEKKLQKEVSSGTRILLNYYRFANWAEITQKNNIYLYQKD
jgi:tRNA A58 N-methylase Trm61